MGIESVLNITVGIARNAVTANNEGGWPQVPGTPADVPARLYPASAKDVEMGKQIKAAVSHVLIVAAGTDVQRNDIVTIGTRRFDATAILPPSFPHHLKVLLNEEQKGAIKL